MPNKKHLEYYKVIDAYDYECALLIIRAEKLIGEWRPINEPKIAWSWRKFRWVFRFKMKRR